MRVTLHQRFTPAIRTRNSQFPNPLGALPSRHEKALSCASDATRQGIGLRCSAPYHVVSIVVSESQAEGRAIALLVNHERRIGTTCAACIAFMLRMIASSV